MNTTNPDKTLNIYRASAGSGKTHLLTGFYIKLLFLPELLPETHSGEMHFSEVLAVTFTNKATAEMKGRIIDELHLLSKTPRKSHYWDEISQDGRRTEQQIRRKATELLVQILNEYSSFNISTIDSFFQKIVRSFARELNVPGNYEVELDSREVVEAAVVNFLDKLDPKQNRSLFDWMVRFSDRRSEEGEGWDFRSKLLEMTNKVITSEPYRRHGQQIKEFTSDKKKLKEYEQMLHQIVQDWRKQLTAVGQQGVDLLEQYGIEKSELFQGGAGTTSYLAQWAHGEEKNPANAPRFLTVVADHNKLFKKGSPRVGSELQEQLAALLEAGLELFTSEGYRNYVTASVIQQDFYELGIIANIDEELRNYCNEHNLMLLSSVTELLAKLIGPYDAPFVYEKTGAHLKSYMIDEFQDTSGLQWHNFIPLLSNALSQGYHNLIVGDVKQSIYRWRGSDWGLLDTEINHFEPSHHNDNNDELRTNWRSLPAVVEWNNHFFEYIAKKLDEVAGTTQINRIYKDVSQAIPEEKTQAGQPLGLVLLEYLQPLDADGQPIAKPVKEDVLAEVRRQLPLQIISLQQQGYEPRDIAILCRRKNECRLMAEILLQYKQEHPECPYPMDIISSEALQLGSRPVIQTLISMMLHLLHPESALQRAIAQKSMQRLTEDSLPMQDFSLSEALAFRPLYELTELLIEQLPAGVVQSETPFLQAFRDIVLEFSHSHNADLSAFLAWWEQSGQNKAIATPEAMNAIQIMTIHTSKGLGLPAIILPYATWEMDIDTSHDEIIWCEPTQEPFRQDILLPIKLDRRLADTIFAADFAEERLRSIIDNLNTAYVAFTRAKEALIVLMPQPTGNSVTRLERLLTDYLTTLQKSDELCTCGELHLPIIREGQRTIIGELRTKKDKSENKSDLQKQEQLQKEDASTSFSTALPALSILHSPLQQDTTARQRGNCIHRVLQEIRNSSESMDRIELLYAKGIIDKRIVSMQDMQSTIQDLLTIPQVSQWFAPELQVMNEQALMNSEGKQIRPDRIVIDTQGVVTVIDYKTGDDHHGYRPQVKRYMEALHQLGFKQVKGYLFFLRDKRVVEVR